jgi:hypothetical protein
MENLILHHIDPPCRYCGKPVRGRSDKLFCDVICKNAFHNVAHQQERRDVHQIDRILKHNRKVLKEVLGDRLKVQVPRAALIQQGLQFEFHTHQQKHAGDKQLICCYEYGYICLDQERTLIVRLKSA